MKIEKLDISNNKLKVGIIIGFILAILIVIFINFFTSRANYRNTESIELAKGTINYSIADLNVIAMYKIEDGIDVEITEMPGSDYQINTSRSYCYTTNKEEHDTKVTLSSDNNGNIVMGNLKKGSKCVFYFEYKPTAQEIISKLSKGTVDKITGPACDANTNNSTHDGGTCSMTESGVYAATTSEGTTYYYRGTVDNNWVKFGDYWWRIIRINENGTVRMIYSGTNNTGIQPNKNDGRWVPKDNSQTGKSLYNSNSSDNAYVGFKYGATGASSYTDTHKNTNDSKILTALRTWYNGDSSMDKSLIDGDTGFCNDRELAATNHGNASYNNLGYGKNYTWYAPFDRVAKSDTSTAFASIGEEQKPTFECKNKARDLFTTSSSNGNGALDIPVGLITMDEIIYAGGFGMANNFGYWLYTGNVYHTMSPYCLFINDNAYVFHVGAGGNLTDSLVIGTGMDVRPVINLKASTSFIGAGTVSDPYIPS